MLRLRVHLPAARDFANLDAALLHRIRSDQPVEPRPHLGPLAADRRENLIQRRRLIRRVNNRFQRALQFLFRHRLPFLVTCHCPTNTPRRSSRLLPRPQTPNRTSCVSAAKYRRTLFPASTSPPAISPFRAPRAAPQSSTFSTCTPRRMPRAIQVHRGSATAPAIARSSARRSPLRAITRSSPLPCGAPALAETLSPNPPAKRSALLRSLRSVERHVRMRPHMRLKLLLFVKHLRRI